MTYIYNNYHTSYYADVNADGKINISSYINNIKSLCDIKILQKDVDAIVISNDKEYLRVEKNIKANTVIFIIDRYIRDNAKKLNVDCDLVYTQDEMSKLLKFADEFYQKTNDNQACECITDMCRNTPNC